MTMPEMNGHVEFHTERLESPIIQRGYEHSAQVAELMTALAQAQAQMSNPVEDSRNPHFHTRYASLAAVRNAVTPALTANGIALTQLVAAQGQSVSCTTILWHTSGQYLTSTLTLPVSKADAQGIGGAITYARRYSLAAICNVAGEEDDDGNTAGEYNPPTRTMTPRPAPQTPSVVAPVSQGPPALQKALELEIKAGLDQINALRHAGLYKAVIYHCFGCTHDVLGQQGLAILEQGITLFRHLCTELATHGKGILQPDAQGQATLPPDKWIGQEVLKLAQQAAGEEGADAAGTTGPTWGQRTAGRDDTHTPELVA